MTLSQHKEATSSEFPSVQRTVSVRISCPEEAWTRRTTTTRAYEGGAASVRQRSVPRPPPPLLLLPPRLLGIPYPRRQARLPLCEAAQLDGKKKTPKDPELFRVMADVLGYLQLGASVLLPTTGAGSLLAVPPSTLLPSGRGGLQRKQQRRVQTNIRTRLFTGETEFS